MALQVSYSKKVFRFNFEARTSRGLMEDKISWFIKLWDNKDPGRYGIGECGPLPGLSLDAVPNFENVLQSVARKVQHQKSIPTTTILKELIPHDFPALTFGMETAYLDLLHGGNRIIFQNDFMKGKPIPINGLIWMGGLDFMMQQVHQKIALGFKCIKLKVGALDFDQECDVLRNIRLAYSNNITIRLDANGAFKPAEALMKLDRLSEYNIHSIEQPIKKDQKEMAELCRKSPIPIALDEELIGWHTTEGKHELLTSLKPMYIILKPTLHGGLSGCQDWIEIAQHHGIGWWITSALESNVGLNAICQLTANYTIELPQGLGTGTIYQNNISSPLTVKNGEISYDHARPWLLDLGS